MDARHFSYITKVVKIILKNNPKPLHLSLGLVAWSLTLAQWSVYNLIKLTS
jgi:hypothetical protein